MRKSAFVAPLPDAAESAMEAGAAVMYANECPQGGIGDRAVFACAIRQNGKHGGA